MQLIDTAEQRPGHRPGPVFSERYKVGRAVPSAPRTGARQPSSEAHWAGGGALGTARPTLLGLLFTFCLSALIGAGCASEKTGASPELPSVEARDRTPNEIADAAIEVFRAHDYEVAQHTKRDLLFEKPASHLKRFVYGDWISPSPIWERVHLTLVPEGVLQYRIDCEAHLISNKGDPTEEPVKYAHVSRKTLQQLMDELAARLRQPPAESKE